MVKRVYTNMSVRLLKKDCTKWKKKGTHTTSQYISLTKAPFMLGWYASMAYGFVSRRGTSSWKDSIAIAHGQFRVNKSGYSCIHSFVAIWSKTFVHVLYDIAANPEYIDPIREEIETIIRNEGWSKKSLTKMTKLDSVIKESLRIHCDACNSWNFWVLTLQLAPHERCWKNLPSQMEWQFILEKLLQCHFPPYIWTKKFMRMLKFLIRFDLAGNEKLPVIPQNTIHQVRVRNI